MTSKLTLAYDGGPFAGWAIQPGLRTVAAEVVHALQVVLRQPVDLTVAGRTDRGVHALGQVISYPGPLPRLRSVNALLPHEISVYEAEAVPDDFSARYDARSRAYVYRVLARSAPDPFERGRALWWPYPLDFSVLEACAAALPGTHDFTAFTPTDTYHQRFERTVLSASWTRTGPLLEFRIEALSFMRNMNRILVGTMLEAAQGQRDGFERLLEGAPRSAAGRTAPPHGLYLERVRYT
ncbi:tRNA pseudouridine(38-40) synthase TruA [Solirubrobacter phytolaccae]|uniref:tRNA pseudouridine synthase A n=1 Tax=Solirubrobacter phytolaccae TaxID=1404360 RepID=A0A9X3SDE2_9ACTN|nr:tRNA pseudouridine(38-40) synthase TruA [Solirubrobacter phytolaccae]MDA0183575.1 tRNA pseudouridine(38-40) synthase TruA [Solirubrobacter phytolaccae]